VKHSASAPNIPLEPWTRRPVAVAVATGLGVGMIRPYSGSWGSIPAAFLAWGILRLGNDWLFVATVLAMIAISVWAASHAEHVFGADSGRIVIDEFAGVFVCMLGLPTHWHVLIPVYIIFRIIDVTKPYPCHRFEALPSGWGVTADDLAAGVYTNAAVRILIWIWPAWFGA